MPIKLPRLPIGWKDQPALFERYWDEAMTQVESNINSLLAVPAIQAALQTVDLATQAANSAAELATSVAQITSSGVVGAVITATDTGASTSVSISAHSRVYGDGVIVPVGAGTITSLSYNTLYYIYYLDPDRTGGVVTYSASSSQSEATQVGSRHLVGQITTPASGGATSNGDYVAPPGVGNIYK